MVNNVVLVGRLTKDPELRLTQSEKSVCTFTLAIDRPKKDAGADFINCVAWDKTAEFADKYFSKGSMMSVVGQIQTRSYEDKSGNKRTATEILVERVGFCGSSKTAEKASEKPTESGFRELDEDDGDLPF